MALAELTDREILDFERPIIDLERKIDDWIASRRAA